MSPKVRYGLITGGVGALLNLCASIVVPCCGLILAPISGGVAGYLTGQKEQAATKGGGAKAGAVSGAISGALVLVGQMIGGVISLFAGPAIFKALNQSPSSFDFSGGNVALGLGILCCLGLVSVGLGAGAGALGGLLATPSQTATATR